MGDFALATKDETVSLGKKLNGHKNIASIIGTENEAGFEDIFGEQVIFNFENIGAIQFSHHRISDEDTHYINLYGHQHDKPTDDEHHRCVSVEMINYTPILLEEAIKGLTPPEE